MFTLNVYFNLLSYRVRDRKRQRESVRYLAVRVRENDEGRAGVDKFATHTIVDHPLYQEYM